MKVAMSSQMREIDRRAADEYGVSGLVLMENAGVEIVRQAEQLLGTLAQKKVCVFCGKGNNGGDGFVAARHLYNQGVKVKVFFWGDRQELREEAAANLLILEKMELDVMSVKGERDWDKAKLAATFADCLIDALVGIGFSGKAEGELARLIQLMNKSGKPIIAVDIPSGVSADNGQVGDVAISATHTVTFGLPKPGLLLYPGAQHSGGISVADIGIPGQLLRDETIRQELLLPETIRTLLPKRQPDAHKGMCGRILIIAGSEGYAGAAVLAAEGALRSGAGLVTLAVPREIYSIVAMKLTEVMVQPLPDDGVGRLSETALPRLHELAKEADVVAVGPGLGVHEQTVTALREFMNQAPCSLIIDADALAAFAAPGQAPLQPLAVPVLTPHPGELARMTGLSAEAINGNRIGVARRFAEEWGAVLVLKGARTVVAFPDGAVHVNLSGTAAMAGGGMGDVLTGVIGGLVGQGLSCHHAALAGTHIHGAAGETAAQSALCGITAGDLVKALPQTIQEAGKCGG